ncbi:MAG: METTL5 family protein [Halobacteriota archaeon]
MRSRRQLARALAGVVGFEEPDATLEQYATPPEVAASVVHEAALRGDLDRPVVDLGAGTGVLAIAAALGGARTVVGLERDPAAVATAAGNAARLGVGVNWVVGDVEALPLDPPSLVTVVANPPFGAHLARRGADRPFLAAAADIAAVSYTVHNAGSLDFLRAFVGDFGGELTHSYRATIDLPRQFDHHRSATHELDAVVVRIAWG